MANTFTTLLKLLKPQVGGENNTWGDDLNSVFDALDKIYRDQGGALTTGGSANAYSVSPAWGDISALTDGVHIRVRIHAANTTTSTINYDSLGAVTIKKKVDGVATVLVRGDLLVGQYAKLIYSATDACWILENPGVLNTLTFHDWVDVASASTTDIGAAASVYVNVTGTTTITALGTAPVGYTAIVKFAGALTLTHNATSLILPTGANINTTAGNVAMFKSEGSGNWRCLFGFSTAASVTMATAAQIWAGTSTNAIGVDQMQAALAEVTLTDGATVTVDFGAGINFKLTIGGNRTLALTVPAGAVGRSGYIRVVQDGTGSRVLTMSAGTIFNINAQNLVLTTDGSAEDVIFYTIISTTKVLMSMARAIG